jgi:hypothetical protein
MSELENWALSMGAPVVPRVSPALLDKIMGRGGGRWMGRGGSQGGHTHGKPQGGFYRGGPTNRGGPGGRERQDYKQRDGDRNWQGWMGRGEQ